MGTHAPDTRRAEAKAQTRARVLASARTMFEAQGYEAATMREIAKAAGLSTGSIFASFDSKSDLFAAVYGQPPLCPVEAVKLGFRSDRRAASPLADPSRDRGQPSANLQGRDAA